MPRYFVANLYSELCVPLFTFILTYSQMDPISLSSSFYFVQQQQKNDAITKKTRKLNKTHGNMYAYSRPRLYVRTGY